MAKRTRIEKWLAKRTNLDAAIAAAIAATPTVESPSFESVASVGLDAQGAPTLNLERTSIPFTKALELRDWITAQTVPED